MGKRILAWVLIIAFILLVINITFIHFQLGPSMAIYGIILAYYLITNMRKPKQ